MNSNMIPIMLHVSLYAKMIHILVGPEETNIFKIIVQLMHVDYVITLQIYDCFLQIIIK